MREYSTAQFSTFKDANPDKEGAGVCLGSLDSSALPFDVVTN